MPDAKIVRIITRLNIGGPAQHAVYLSKLMEKYGWSTILITGRVDPSVIAALPVPTVLETGSVSAPLPETPQEVTPVFISVPGLEGIGIAEGETAETILELYDPIWRLLESNGIVPVLPEGGLLIPVGDVPVEGGE